jgi:hypothetical protein
VVDGYTVDAGSVPQEREESCNVQAEHGGPTSCYAVGSTSRRRIPRATKYGPFILLQGIAPRQWLGKRRQRDGRKISWLILFLTRLYPRWQRCPRIDWYCPSGSPQKSA